MCFNTLFLVFESSDILIDQKTKKANLFDGKFGRKDHWIVLLITQMKIITVKRPL